MTQEDKELLLKDLCARLPYGIHAKIKRMMLGEEVEYAGKVGIDIEFSILQAFPYKDDIDIKPYLRPMSSMSNEEKEELKLEQEKDEELFIQVINKSQNGDDSLLGTVIPHCAEDWANKNHFDYRGLIEKGLAIKASNEMYKQ